MSEIFFVSVIVVLLSSIKPILSQTVYGNTCSLIECKTILCGSTGMSNGNSCWYNCCWNTMRNY